MQMTAVSPPRPRLNLCVGITGHRPPAIDARAETEVEPILTEALTLLADATAGLRARYSSLFDDAPLVPRFISALAEGADQFGAAIALKLGYRLDAILPLPREDYRADFEPAGLARFTALLDRADRILELPLQASGRTDSYALAGRAIVAHSDIVIALWDGEPARGVGGTAEVVALALRRGIPVIHLTTADSGPGRILSTGYGNFVDPSDLANIPSRPVDAETLRALAQAILGPPSDPHALRDLRRYLAERERLLRPRSEYPLLLALLGVKGLRRSAFSSDPYEHSTRLEWRPFREACAAERHGVTAPLDQIEQSFAWADRLAQHFGQIYRSGQVLNFSFGAAAVLIALTGLLLPGAEFWLALAEPSVIAIFVVNTLVGTRRQWHRRWLEYRQLAERIRPMRSLKLLSAAAPPIVGHLEDQQATGWIDWYARAEWRAAGIPTGRLMGDSRLIDAIAAEELQPQIDYNRASAHHMHLLDHRLHRVGMLLFGVSILSCLGCVVANLLAHEWARDHAGMFIAFSAGLPALGGAIFGIRMQGDFGGTGERSLKTAQDLAKMSADLRKPENGLARQIDLTEAAAATMFADLAEWQRVYHRRALQIN